MMARRGLILMTALPVTVGHVHLVRFAQEYMSATPGLAALDVVVSSRGHEPVPGHARAAALDRDVGDRVTAVHLHEDDDAPQSPRGPDDEPFWQYWRDTIEKITGTGQFDYVFASEPYGAKLAEVVGAEWIPCDVGRLQVEVRATDVRLDAIRNFRLLSPSMAPWFRKTVTLFGAESCGKTTLARALGSHEALGSPGWVPEWARQYLEAVGPKLSSAKMDTITRGQYAAQEVAAHKHVPFVIQDTDLVSTLGYYRLWNSREPELVRNLAGQIESDLYLVCTSRGVLFEPDALRYGGDRRESSDDFWIYLLEERKLRYHVLSETSREGRVEEAVQVLTDFFHRKYDMRQFRRD
jgi:NadR type nicotinamide-nucleotide adenylyltransferase